VYSLTVLLRIYSLMSGGCDRPSLLYVAVKELMEKKRRELEAKQKKLEEVAQKRAEMLQRKREQQRR